MGDEIILFSLLTRIQDTRNPDQISLLSGDPVWLEDWLIQHKDFFPPILHKLQIMPNPTPWEYLKMILGFGKKYDFYIFGGGQVVDEERKFPHNGRNLPLLFRRVINKGNFALVGGIGTQNKDGTPILHKMLLEKAQIVVLRDSFSEGLAEKLLPKNMRYKVQTIGDFSLSLLEESKKLLEKGKIKTSRDPYVLINLSPLCTFPQAIKKIKSFLRKHPNAQPIYFPAHLHEDLQYFTMLQEQIPPIELFDWTKAGVATTMKLFYFAEAGIGAKLHFLYPLKYFGVPYEVLVNNHKNQVNLADID
ncbi:MAG: polysaccharide pyruvyl transferase family protein [Candidatus Peribacteria bacterium]|nr:polysaccharide pyruvyl transferase family protein [Candidatus Peribacteria bacterium]